nr:hypothetical protein Iba_scaffold34358CG0010 [Ipomoea batatas]GMD12534.1 hypothetical protein Iba_scaffold40454CG0020 [Ipomoea batatas]GME20125.1 hypothetical protein Iba_scaffold24386.2CG0780 [Ipomoea batatas]
MQIECIVLNACDAFRQPFLFVFDSVGYHSLSACQSLRPQVSTSAIQFQLVTPHQAVCCELLTHGEPTGS